MGRCALELRLCYIFGVHALAAHVKVNLDTVSNATEQKPHWANVQSADMVSGYTNHREYAISSHRGVRESEKASGSKVEASNGKAVNVEGAAGGKVASMAQVFILCVVMYGGIGVLWLCYSRLPVGGEMRTGVYIVLLCFTWASMSIGMQVLNKTLVVKLQAPALISVAQMWIAVICVGVPGYRAFMEVERRAVCTWLIVPIFFAAMLCTSFYTYQYISLSLYTVIRNLTPLVVLPIERAVMPLDKRPQISFLVMIAIGVMLLGALLYAGGIKDISLIGIVFAVANMFLAVCDRLIQRRLLTTECQGLPSAVCTVMNNALGSLPAIILASATHQFQEMGSPVHRAHWEDPRCIVMLLLSGLVGIGICYLGFECQRAISATSFFVLQNVSKVAVVFCGILFFGDPIKSPLTIIGLFLSLGGSFVYGKSQMDLAAEKATKEAIKEAIKDQCAQGKMATA